MKHLPPTLREDQRYLKFKIHSEEDVEFSDVVEAIWDSALGFLGEKELSRADPWIMKNLYSSEKQEGVIKINSKAEEDFRASILFISEISGSKAFVSVEQVSGTVKSLEGIEE